MPVPTTDHDEIRQWAKKHAAQPAEHVGALHDGLPAILSFVFGNVVSEEPGLRVISWESFFAQFDLFGLALAFGDGGQFDLVQIFERAPARFHGKPVC